MKKVKYIIMLMITLLLVSCDKDDSSNNNDDDTPTPTPTPIVVQVDNVGELLEDYKSETEAFLNENLLDDLVKYSTQKSYNESDVIYAAWDLGAKTDTNLDSVELQFTVKYGETDRTYYVNSAEFDSPIALNDIAEYSKNKDELSAQAKELEINNSVVRNFDAKEKQNDTEYLNKVYNDYDSANAYIVNKEYVKETFTEEFKVSNVGELTTTYVKETESFLASCYANYLVENNISVESVKAETIDWNLDELANATDLSQVTLTFTYTTETKEITKEVTFDLSDITLEQVAKYSENKEAVDALIESAEITKDVSSENNIQTATTIEELITEHGDTVNTNLETVYKATLKKYKISEDTVTNYRWDLGKLTTDNKIQNLKLFLERTSRTSTTTSFVNVMNVDLTTATSIDDLLNNTFDTIATYSQSYSYSYDNTNQNNRTDLINAILQVAVTDGFDYTNAKILYTEKSQSLHSTLGTVDNFNVVILTDNGVREIIIRIATASTDAELINKINNNKFSVSEYNNVIDYDNVLENVDLTIEAENE